MDIGNGKCTIKSTLEDAFVDVKRVGPDGDWTPVLFKTTPAPQWDIKKVGDFEYSITVKRPINNVPEPRCIALTVKNNVVTLKLMNNAHNQLWLIEAIDQDSFDPPPPQPRPQPRAQDEHQPQPQPQPQPQSHPHPQQQPEPQLPEVAPGLPEGEYLIRSENGFYLDLPRSQNGCPSLSKARKTYFKVEKVPRYQFLLGAAHIYNSATREFLYQASATYPRTNYYAFRTSDEDSNLLLLHVSQLDPLRYEIISDRFTNLLEPSGASEGITIDSADYGVSKNWEFIPRVA